MESERYSAGNGHRKGPEALRQIPALIQEFRDYAEYYAGIRKDLAAAKVRDVAGKGALGVIGLVVFAGIVLVSTWLMLTGIAMGLGWLFRGWMGLAYFILGLVVLGGTVGFAWFAVRYWGRRSGETTIQKYEELRQAQRQRYASTRPEQAAEAVRAADEAARSGGE